MINARSFKHLLQCLLAGWVVLSLGGVARATNEDLPSSVKSRVRQINSALDQVDKALAADRLTTAQRKLKEANKKLAEIKKRYTGKFSEDHPDYKAMTERLAAAAKKVDDSTGAAASAAESAAKAQKENDALCEAWVVKLGPFIDHGSDLYLRIGSELNGASAEDQAKSRAAYAKAKVLMEEYKTVKFPLGKSMSLQGVESRLTSSMTYYGQDEEAAKQAEACAPWVAKLRPFVEFGVDNSKVLIASPTVDAQQIQHRQAIYEEARSAFDAYRKAELPLGKTAQLKQLEKELASRLEAFPGAMAESQTMMSGDIGTRLDAFLAYLDRDDSWKTDDSKKPPTIMERDLKPLREGLARMAGTVAGDDSKLAELKSKLKAIEATDAKHRKIRSERTFQTPDQFPGEQLDALKAQAIEVVKAEYKDVEILRTTVSSEDWAIEDVIEATDSTNSALRHRITRSVRSQLAIKRGDGKVYLQEVYLGQDKQPDGWGPLKGHTTWCDWMSEDNVGKEAP